MTVDDPDSELQGLTLRALDGDENALGQVLEQHREWLKISAENELDGQLAARIDASDIVQQTFLSAYHRIQQFEGGTPREFAAWLRQIQKRNIQDAIRQHVAARRRSVNREQTVDDENSLADGDATTPSQQIMRGEQSAALLQALERLPADQQAALRLRHFEGQSLDQLAQYFGRSKTAVAGLIKRGLENLRNQVPGE